MNPSSMHFVPEVYREVEVIKEEIERQDQSDVSELI